MADRRNEAAAPETTTTVTGASWEGEDISGQSHTRVAFVDLDMTEVTNTGAVFTECIFRRAKFNCSVHTAAAFVNCTFTAATSSTRAHGLQAHGEHVRPLLLRHDQDRGRQLVVRRPARCRPSLRVDERSAAARGGPHRVRCQGASLRDVDMSGAALHGADFTDCDLRGSDVSALNPGDCTITGAIVTSNQAIVIAQALGLDVRAE